MKTVDPMETVAIAMDRERRYQSAKWGYEQDNQASPNDFVTWSLMTAAKGGGNAGNAGTDEARQLVQKSMVGGASVALAAMETIARTNPDAFTDAMAANGVEGKTPRAMALAAMKMAAERMPIQARESFNSESRPEDWIAASARQAGSVPAKLSSAADVAQALDGFAKLGGAAMAGAAVHEMRNPGVTQAVARTPEQIADVEHTQVLRDRPEAAPAALEPKTPSLKPPGT